MSLEAELPALLQAVCLQVFPDIAPPGTVPPYLTWQGIGGDSLRYGDSTAPDKRNTLLQVSVWSKTRLEALALIRQVEEALCASPSLNATPQGEALSAYEPDAQLRGCIQRFDIWATR